MTYIRNRLSERSTWIAVAAAATAAAALSPPWSYVVFVVSAFAALLPGGK
jgi:hypothetical protein